MCLHWNELICQDCGWDQHKPVRLTICIRIPAQIWRNRNIWIFYAFIKRNPPAYDVKPVKPCIHVSAPFVSSSSIWILFSSSLLLTSIYQHPPLLLSPLSCRLYQRLLTTVCEYWNIMDLSVRTCSILHIFPYAFKVCAHRRCSHAASLKRSCWGFSTTIPPKGLLPWKLTKKRLLYSTLFYSSVVWSSLKAFFHPVCPSFSFRNLFFFSLSRICLRIKHLNGLNGVQSLGFHNGSGYAVALCV